AASAIAGYICSPTPDQSTTPHFGVSTPASDGDAAPSTQHSAPPSVEIIPGFPSTLRGRLLWLDRDNLNTDGIYAGKWTYKDDLTPEQMAGVIFENYDPAFRTLARPGDVVVGGANIGAGSSREQAAT